jgi:hypothetical protein
MRWFDGFVFRFLRIVAPNVPRFILFKRHRAITLPERNCSADGNGAGRHSLPSVDLAAHPTNCAKLVVIYPGLSATRDGECVAFNQAHPSEPGETTRTSGHAKRACCPTCERHGPRSFTDSSTKRHTNAPAAPHTRKCKRSPRAQAPAGRLPASASPPFLPGVSA